MKFKFGTHIVAAIFISLFVYVGGLLLFFLYPGKGSPAVIPIENASAFSQAIQDTAQSVLGVKNKEAPAQKDLPDSYTITIIPRKQMFNLSCEFSAATAILFHYTADKAFAVSNAIEAEKILIQQVGASQNPNIGIRMGENLPKTAEELYANLNKRFGGEYYYGAHAPPFIDVFARYCLNADILSKDENTINSLQIALSSGHLVMAWLKIGYGGTVDVVFDYGGVPVVKGEHVVVVHGYDKKGVFIMDPGNGSFKHISYKDFLAATALFSLPFLEVYVSVDNKPSLEDTLLLGKTTGLLRENLNIIIENGTKKVGKGDQASAILREFGYHIDAVRNADNFEHEGVTITIKDSLKDYTFLLKKDLAAAEYKIASVSADLSASSSADAIIIVGD